MRQVKHFLVECRPFYYPREILFEKKTQLNKKPKIIIFTLCEDLKVFVFYLKVLNQTSRLEIQLLENSLSTYKLEKQLLQQTNEILKIHEKNRWGLLYCKNMNICTYILHLLPPLKMDVIWKKYRGKLIFNIKGNESLRWL